MKRRAAGEADASQDKKPRARGPLTGAEYELDLNRFPDKIRWLLDNRVAPEALWWMPNGDAIAINKKLFIDQLLVKHFRGNKFPSITRKLNRWGFRRIEEDKEPPGAMAYSHELFHRNYPERLRLMIREEDKKRGSTSSNETSDSPYLRQQESLTQASRTSSLAAQGAALLGADSSLLGGAGGAIGLGGVQATSLWAATREVAARPAQSLAGSLQGSSTASSTVQQQLMMEALAARQPPPRGPTLAGIGTGTSSLVAPFHSDSTLLGRAQQQQQPQHPLQQQLAASAVSNNPQALSLAVANPPAASLAAEVSAENQLAASILEERRLEEQLRQVRSRNDAAASRVLAAGAATATTTSSQLDTLPNDSLFRQLLQDQGATSTSGSLLPGLTNTATRDSSLDQLLAARRQLTSGNTDATTSTASATAAAAAALAASRASLSVDGRGSLGISDRERSSLVARLSAVGGQPSAASYTSLSASLASSSTGSNIDQLLLLRQQQEQLEQERLLQLQQRRLSQNVNDPATQLAAASLPASLLGSGDTLAGSRFSVADQLRLLQEQERIRREQEEQKQQGDRRFQRYP